MTKDELIKVAEEYFNKNAIWNGTIILNPIDMMVGFATFISGLDETKAVKQNEQIQEILKYLTKNSSNNSGERLAFYVDYIQPIKEYFKIE